jgi:hypothetical protein
VSIAWSVTGEELWGIDKEGAGSEVIGAIA